MALPAEGAAGALARQLPVCCRLGPLACPPPLICPRRKGKMLDIVKGLLVNRVQPISACRRLQAPAGALTPQGG